MALTALDVQKMTFGQRLRGYDPQEVDEFLSLVADELTARVAEIDRLRRECEHYRERLEGSERREHQLQETMLRAQKVADEMTAAARREAEIVVREAELTADRIVRQAIEQSTKVEGKIGDLRAMRRELQLKFKNTLDLFNRILDADMEEERSTATVRTLPRKQKEA